MKKKRRPTPAMEAASAEILERGPTPETRAKAVPNVTDSLARRGRLTAVEVEAAAAIERMHAALGRCMFPARELDVSLRGTGSKRSAPVSWLDRLSEREIRVWKRVYMPWAKAMGGVQYIGCPVNVLAVVTAIVQDNDNLGQCEKRFGMKMRSALGILRYGLRRYAVVAGL